MDNEDTCGTGDKPGGAVRPYAGVRQRAGCHRSVRRLDGIGLQRRNLGVGRRCLDETERFGPHPPKNHKFDLASTDRRYVGETKNYTWTESGNMPSAKMAFVNEAVFYLSHLPADITRFVAMPRDLQPKTGEPLADYYHRTYRHLLNGVLVVEIDAADGSVRVLGQGNSGCPHYTP